MSTRVEDAPPVGVNVEAAESAEDVEARSYWALAFARFRRDKLAIFSLLFIIFLVLAAFVGGPVAARLLGHGPNDLFPLTGVDPFTQIPVGPWTHVSYEGSSLYPQPTGDTLFILGGADGNGKDLFLRLLYGAQTSLEVGVFTTVMVVLLGVIMGLAAGYFRGWVDTAISRLIEIVMVFPGLLLIIGIQTVAGQRLNELTLGGLLRPGVFTLVLIFSLFGWFYPARIVRGVVLSLREKEFVEAARMTGASDFRIMRSHLLPHLVAPIIVYSTIAVAGYILAEAALSFLGLGIVPPEASWGILLKDAPIYYTSDIWLVVIPGIAILVTTIAFNLLGDGLRDAIDPRSTV